MNRAFALVALASVACVSTPTGPVVVFRHPNGAVAAEGGVSEHESMDYVTRTLRRKESVAPWHERLRIGPWRYWFPNGQLRASVTYRILSYDECCVAGPCRQPYEVLVGKVLLYDEMGAITYQGGAHNHSVRVDTNCAGGDLMLRPGVSLPDDIAPTF